MSSRAVHVEFDAAAKFRYLRSFPVSALKLACHVSNASLRCEIALEFCFTFGNDAPATRIFVKKDGRYLCAMTIAENGFVRGHEHVSLSAKF